jgi:hypothetical protein
VSLLWSVAKVLTLLLVLSNSVIIVVSRQSTDIIIGAF